MNFKWLVPDEQYDGILVRRRAMIDYLALGKPHEHSWTKCAVICDEMALQYIHPVGMRVGVPRGNDAGWVP